MATTQDIVARGETTLTVSWSIDHATSSQQLSWSTDGGTTWSPYIPVSGTSGEYTITGLTPGTHYAVRTSIQSNGTWVTSGTRKTSTYLWPYATGMPDFTLGNTLRLEIYNPTGHNIRVNLKDVNGTTVTSVSGAGTSATFFQAGIDWTSAIAALYASIPSAMSANYRVEVVTEPLTDAHSEIRTGGLYQVDQAASVPVIGTLTYADNSAAAAITGDSSQIVQNISTPLFTASGLAAVNGASLATCGISVNGATYSATPSATTNIQAGTVNAAANIIATLTLTDSRGLTSTATVEVQMVPWSNPTGIISVQRQQNFYTATDVKVDADFTQIGSSAVTITLTGDAVPIPGKTTPAQVTATIPDNVTTVVNFDNEFEWNITITLVDSFGGTTTYTGIHIGRGIPINFVDRILRSYAVNGFPTHENSIEVFDGSFYKDGADIASLFPITPYNSHDHGNLTASLNRSKTYTVTGAGLVYISASLRTGTNSWGTTKVTIFHNNSEVAKSTDVFTANYNGQETSASTSAFLQVANGDTIRVEDVSTRYTSGNTWDAWNNVLAFGCTLTAS